MPLQQKKNDATTGQYTQMNQRIIGNSLYELERASEYERMQQRISQSRTIDWKLIDDLLKMRTDTLLIEYLTKMKQKVTELVDE